MPNMSAAGQAVGSAGSRLPSPPQLAFYGGLAATAVFGVIEWPVAAAIGVGTMIARRARRPGGRSKPE
ncbi:hypothetical protein [Actinomadura vinacea]